MLNRNTSNDASWAAMPGPDSILRRELDNGLVVLALENPASPSVVIQGRVGIGSLAVPRERAGLAGFGAEMLMRGTERRTFAQIHESIESVGASLEFEAEWHSTAFSGRCLTEDLPLLLDILADCVRRPIFPSEHMEKVRGEILTSIEERENNTRRMAALTFYETLYEGHPMGVSGLGYKDTISAITRDDLDFYKAHLRPEGMSIAVVGAVSPEEAFSAVEKAFGDWNAPASVQRIIVPEPVPPKEMRRREVTIPGKTQADLVLGWIGLARKDAEYQAARLANTILGVFGMMGRIGDNVRDRQGLAYYAYSSLVGSLLPGPWMAIAGVDPENIDRAVEGILAEVRRLRDEPVPEEELSDNKSYLISSLPIALETNEGVASTLDLIEEYELGLDYLQRYPAMIKELTAADVQRVARKYLNPEVYVLAIARPA